MDTRSPGKHYRIPVESFHKFCHPSAQAQIDKFGEDDHFSIEEIGLLTFSKQYLQSPIFREWFLKTIEEKRREEASHKDHARRCYPSVEDVQVYQFRDDPAGYEMSALFGPARELAQDLRMPVDDDVRYMSSTYGGATFIKSGSGGIWSSHQMRRTPGSGGSE